MRCALLHSSNPVERSPLAMDQREHADELVVNLVSHRVRKALQDETADRWNSRRRAGPPRPCFRPVKSRLKCGLHFMHELVPKAVAPVILPRSGVCKLCLRLSEEYEIHDVLAAPR